jgi:hypothetical protein
MRRLDIAYDFIPDCFWIRQDGMGGPMFHLDASSMSGEQLALFKKLCNASVGFDRSTTTEKGE